MAERSIRKLPQTVVDRIAAGEVITRPSRVVTELIDNALDAGASAIEIEVAGGGTERIAVSDDGCGMARADAERAIDRHTTSKLDPADDAAIGRIDTLGFRGEALASIAACATVSIVTSDGRAVGTKLHHEPRADEPTVTDAGRAQGTTVTVTNLFDTMPARRQSLAGAATEFRRIVDRVTAYALCRPEVRFTLRHDGTETLSTTGRGVTDALLGIYDREVASHASTFDHERAVTVGETEESVDVSIDGALVSPAIDRSRKDHIRVAVNGRPVLNGAIETAVREGYGPRLPSERFPIAVVRLDVPPALVDPNVHPAKETVGLVGEDAIGPALTDAIDTALSSGDDRRASAVVTDLDTAIETGRPASRFDELSVIGTFRSLYLLCEADDELIVIDQHAAHERVNYERLRAAFDGRPIETAELDPPATVSLSPTARATLDAHAEAIAELGYDVEPFDDSTVRVKTVPAPFGRTATATSIRDAVGSIASDGSGTDPREELLAELACHPSIKAGDELSAEATQALIDRLGECTDPYRCPHGRPTMTTLSEASLASAFDRQATRFQ